MVELAPGKRSSVVVAANGCTRRLWPARNAALSSPAPVQRTSVFCRRFCCASSWIIGIHRFYVGKVGTGILLLLTLGVFGSWTLIDFVLIIIGAFIDKHGNKITRRT